MKVLLIVLCLAGCASAPDRYLTVEEDAALRKACEPTGCAAVPIPIWQKIQKLLNYLQDKSI